MIQQKVTYPLPLLKTTQRLLQHGTDRLSSNSFLHSADWEGSHSQAVCRSSESRLVATSPPLEDPTLINPRLPERGQRCKRRTTAGIMRTSGVTAVRTKRSSERRKALLLTGRKCLSHLWLLQIRRHEGQSCQSDTCQFCFFPAFFLTMTLAPARKEGLALSQSS